MAGAAERPPPAHRGETLARGGEVQVAVDRADGGRFERVEGVAGGVEVGQQREVALDGTMAALDVHRRKRVGLDEAADGEGAGRTQGPDVAAEQ